MRRKVGGTVEILGRDATEMTPRQITELGVAHIPEDRNKHGLVEPYSDRRQPGAQPLSAQAPFARRGCATTQAIERRGRPARRRLRRPHARHRRRGRHAVGRQPAEGDRRPRARRRRRGARSSPSRPAGSTSARSSSSTARSSRLRDRGAAVLLVSAELDEILSLSDRIGVLYRGRLVGDVRRAPTPPASDLGYLMATGADPDPRRSDDPSTTGPATCNGTADRGTIVAHAWIRGLVEPPAGPRSRCCALLLSFVVGGVLICARRASTRSRPTGRCCAACSAARSASPARSPGRCRSSARPSPLAFAFRAGLFNIGAEGQLLIGGVTAAWVGTWAFMYDMPGILAIPIIMLAGFARRGRLGRRPGCAAGPHRAPTR